MTRAKNLLALLLCALFLLPAAAPVCAAEDKPICAVTLDACGGKVSPDRLTDALGYSVTLPVPSKSYTVTFDGTGGTSAVQSAVLDCVCTGWYTSPSGSAVRYDAGAAFTLTGDARLYARWTDPVLGTLPTASRSGYTFLGWSTVPGGSIDVTAAMTITANTRLYAVWSADKPVFTVTLDTAGGSVSPAALSAVSGTTVTLPVPGKSYTVQFFGNGGSVSKTSAVIPCTCTGWYTGTGADAVRYTPGGLYTVSGTAVLYARWTNPSIGTLPTAVRSGFVFKGWSTTPDGRVNVSAASILSESKSLYAVWDTGDSPILSVTLVPAGGTVTPDVLSDEIGYSVKLPAPVKTCTVTFVGNGGTPEKNIVRLNSRCTGWYTTPSGSGTQYDVGASYVLTANTILYARWEDPVIGTLPTAARADYFFKGWSTDPHGGVNVHADTVITSDTTLYAVWGRFADSYAVTLHPMGGLVSPTILSGATGSVVTLPVPTKSYVVTFDGNGGTANVRAMTLNCFCAGWYTSAAGAGAHYEPGGSYTLNSEADLYARWSDPVLYAMPGAEKAGFTLVGWYTQPVGGVRVLPGTQIPADMHLYAHWKHAAAITRIDIASMPKKQIYRYHETERDYSGLELYVEFADGSNEIVRDLNQMEFSAFSTDTVGTKTVFVTYEGAVASLRVRVRYAWWQWLIRIFLLGFLWY